MDIKTNLSNRTKFKKVREFYDSLREKDYSGYNVLLRKSGDTVLLCAERGQHDGDIYLYNPRYNDKGRIFFYDDNHHFDNPCNTDNYVEFDEAVKTTVKILDLCDRLW